VPERKSVVAVGPEDVKAAAGVQADAADTKVAPGAHGLQAVADPPSE
jgi:hypothetical protein